MADKPNFVLVPDDERGRPAGGPPAPQRHVGEGPAPALGRLGALLASAGALLALRAPAVGERSASASWTGRPRLVFGFDATASREPAWAAARQVTDALVRALPGELEVALAVHGGGRLHTFTDFTANAQHAARPRRRDRLPRGTDTDATDPFPRSRVTRVRVVTYIGDVFEESPGRGRKLADALGRQGIKLIVLHDVADWLARRDAEVFLNLARRSGGCVLPFDASAPGRLRNLLAAVANVRGGW